MPITKKINKSSAKVAKERTTSLEKSPNLESIINLSPVIYCIWRFAEDAPVEYISANIEQLGYTPEDFISGSLSWYGITHPEDVPRLKAEILMHMKQKTRQFDQNYRIFDSKGKTRWVEDQTVFIFDRTGKITHAQGAVIDVTERKKTQIALYESENIYRTIFENTGTAMAIADKNRITLLVNKKLQELTGFTKEELVGNNIGWEQFIAPRDMERLKNYHRLRLKDPDAAPKNYEYQIITKNGEIKDLLMTSTLIPGTQNSLVSMMDVSAWKKAEEALHKSEEHLRELLQNSSDIISIFDQNGVFQYVSPSVKKILGYNENEIIGKSAFDFIHPDDMQMAINDFNEVTQFLHDRIATEFRFLHKNGHWVNMEALGSNLLDNPAISGIVISTRDISERKRMEAQLFHSQKMEAIGTLAGGIAHDFNNILMGIQGYISLMLLNMDTIHPEFEKLINIQALVQSGADLTGKLLGFARGGQYEVKPTDLNELISKTVNLFGRTKKDISFHQKYEKNPWTAEVDRIQIEQVLLNLYVNAWQAMPEGGDIYIETKNVTNHKIVATTNIAAGDYINITITDTGIRYG